MKKIKNILIDLGNFLGYGSIIGLGITNCWLLYNIYKHEKICFAEPNHPILLIEIVLIGGMMTFILYKLIKTIRDKYTLK